MHGFGRIPKNTFFNHVQPNPVLFYHQNNLFLAKKRGNTDYQSSYKSGAPVAAPEKSEQHMYAHIEATNFETDNSGDCL